MIYLYNSQKLKREEIENKRPEQTILELWVSKGITCIMRIPEGKRERNTRNIRNNND